MISSKGEMLFRYYAKYGLFAYPGGGLEEGDAWDSCLKRELLEETGFLVKGMERVGYTLEFREGSRVVVNVLFKVVADRKISDPVLTEDEIEYKMTAVWLRPNHAFNLVKRNVPSIKDAFHPDRRCKKISQFLIQNGA